ncbi:MAG: hypothetical protein COC08_08830 [Maribacter sp.]|nr:MAG: hypothetical protein COC08_08830 [Maribacter sp.]
MRIYYFVLILIALSSCADKKKYHDVVDVESQEPSSDALKEVLEFQKELNEEFKDPETSPLPDRYRKDFEKLDFFQPDTNYIVRARFVLTPEALPFMMPTTSDRKSEEVLFGIAYFSLNGKEHQLEIYQNKMLMLQEKYRDYLFLPFTDKTNGEATYTGGRYIDLRIPNENFITINFNKAYNPYCAYNKKYSCPLVPSVNELGVAVNAGVKAFRRGVE